MLWLPPLVQQATGHPGNVTALARYTGRDEPTAGWNVAFGTMGTHLRPTGPWLSDDEQTEIGFERLEGVWVAVLTLVVTAGLGGLAARHGHRSAAALAAVALSAVALAVVSTARVTGPLLAYVIAFWRPIAAITYLSIVWSALVLVARRAAWRAATAVSLAVLAALGVSAIAAAPVTPPIPALSRAIGAVGPPTVAALRPDRRYLVEGQDNATLNGGVAGLAWYLEAHGRRAFLAHEKLAALRFGGFRLADRDAVDGRVLLVAQSAADTGWTRPEGAELVARFDPLSPTERARRTAPRGADPAGDRDTLRGPAPVGRPRAARPCGAGRGPAARRRGARSPATTRRGVPRLRRAGLIARRPRSAHRHTDASGSCQTSSSNSGVHRLNSPVSISMNQCAMAASCSMVEYPDHARLQPSVVPHQPVGRYAPQRRPDAGSAPLRGARWTHR